MDCYSDPYGYCVADARRYAADNSNGNPFLYAFFAHSNALADVHSNGYTHAPADANAGSHSHAHFASDDL